jgi:hypothetical protein
VTYRREADGDTASDYRERCPDDRQNSGEFDELIQENRHRPASVYRWFRVRERRPSRLETRHQTRPAYDISTKAKQMISTSQV